MYSVSIADRFLMLRASIQYFSIADFQDDLYNVNRTVKLSSTAILYLTQLILACSKSTPAIREHRTKNQDFL